MELEAYGHSKISIHALREEGDPDAAIGADAVVDFYPRPPRGGRRQAGLLFGGGCGFLSTPSARRATTSALPSPQKTEISIHALREEGDMSPP